jgi:hypothetical protein
MSQGCILLAPVVVVAAAVPSSPAVVSDSIAVEQARSSGAAVPIVSSTEEMQFGIPVMLSQ